MDKINHKTTIEHLKSIFFKCRKSKLEFSSDEEVENAFKYLCELFNLSKIQTALLSIIFNFTTDEDLERVKSQRMIDFLRLEIESFFDIKNDLEVLINRGFIKQIKEDKSDNLFNSSFSVNQKLLDMLFRNEEIQFEKLYGNGYSFIQFCGHMYRINNRKLLNHLSREDVLNSVIEQESRNENLTQIKTMKSLDLDVKDRLIMYYMIYKYTENEKSLNLNMIGFDILGPSKVLSLTKRLKEKTTQIQIEGLVELSNETILTLTEKAKELFLDDKTRNTECEEQSEIETSHNYIKHDSISEKKLFFNSNIRRELNIIQTLLQKDNFAEYKMEMKKRGNKAEGISIMLYGPSGTGKTSIVEVLSKQTKRNIYQIDLSQVRSRWYSESEKNVKKIFDDYKLLCSKSEMSPILLINECDALMGRRNPDIQERTDMTEQTIINVLLEHIEKNEGIIIAITNMVEHLDNAFLRRFTIKIHIGHPDIKAVKSILKNKIDFLEGREVNMIAESYSLTGGQIENISTKCIVNRIITKSNPTVNEVIDYCEEEKIKSNLWKEE